MNTGNASVLDRNPWILRGYPDRTAKARLFCFPYAGAAGVIYAKWQTAMPSMLDVCAIMPPGRLGRLREPLFRTIEPYVAALGTTLAELVDCPYFLFGYSMGGLLAFEVAKELIRRGCPAPEGLIVAACKPPHLSGMNSTESLTDNQFIELLSRRYAPLPAAVLSDSDLLEIAVRVMRADFAILHSYQYRSTEPLPCPITVLGGTEDSGCDRDALQAWSKHTAGSFDLRSFPGGHFFMNDDPGPVIQAVRSVIVRRLASIAPQTEVVAE